MKQLNRKKQKVRKKKMESNAFDTKHGRTWLVGLLKTDLVTVRFEKKDGTIREMHCTLMERKIPEEKTPNGKGKKQSLDALAVFDIEKQEWRSFRFDSIKQVEWSVDKSIEFHEGM